MLKTLITDDFVPGEREPEVEYNYEPHNILYGAQGWTDGVDDATIDLLVDAGIVAWYETIVGVGFETRIYVSVKGSGPNDSV